MWCRALERWAGRAAELGFARSRERRVVMSPSLAERWLRRVSQDEWTFAKAVRVGRGLRGRG